MKNVYLNVNFSDGKMFQFNKEEKEDFEKHTSSKGNVSYRKYYDQGVTGILKGIQIKDTKIGDQLQVVIESGEEKFFISFNLRDQKGNIDTMYVMPLLRLLPNMEIGREYRIYPYRFMPEDSKYYKQGVSVKEGEDKVEPAISLEYTTREGEHTKGDIPQLEWKEDKLTNKKKPTAVSVEKRNDVISEFLSDELDRLALPGNTTKKEPEPEKAEGEEKTTPKKTESKKENVKESEAPKTKGKKKLPF